MHASFLADLFQIWDRLQIWEFQPQISKNNEDSWKMRWFRPTRSTKMKISIVSPPSYLSFTTVQRKRRGGCKKCYPWQIYSSFILFCWKLFFVLFFLNVSCSVFWDNLIIMYLLNIWFFLFFYSSSSTLLRTESIFFYPKSWQTDRANADPSRPPPALFDGTVGRDWVSYFGARLYSVLEFLTWNRS